MVEETGWAATDYASIVGSAGVIVIAILQFFNHRATMRDARKTRDENREAHAAIGTNIDKVDQRAERRAEAIDLRAEKRAEALEQRAHERNLEFLNLLGRIDEQGRRTAETVAGISGAFNERRTHEGHGTMQ